MVMTPVTLPAVTGVPDAAWRMPARKLRVCPVVPLPSIG